MSTGKPITKKLTKMSTGKPITNFLGVNQLGLTRHENVYRNKEIF